MTRVGVHHPYEIPVQRFAPEAEAAGFEYFAHGEHVLFREPLLNGFVGLTLAAACTSRIRLVSAITLLPLYPAALAAKLAASVDVASGGRFEFGVGVGGEVPEEFELCGVDHRTRGRRTDAALELIQRLWADDTPDAVGPRLLPKPVQRPGPPVWIAGRGDASIRRTARFGDVWFPYLIGPERLQRGVETLAAECATRGRPTPARTAVSCFIHIGPDSPRAERAARAYVSDLYGVAESSIARYVIGGTSEQVIGRLSEFVQAGADTVLLLMCARDDDAIAMTRRAGAEVLPALAPQNASGSYPSA